jgi:hypothetical protein
MRHNADCNRLITQILEGSLQQSISCGAGSASKIQFIANQYVSECHLRLYRPISRSLPLALEALSVAYQEERSEPGNV